MLQAVRPYSFSQTNSGEKVIVRIVLPNLHPNERVEAMTYEGVDAIDRLRRFCVAFLEGIEGNVGVSDEAKALLDANLSTAIEPSLCSWKQKPEFATLIHEITLPVHGSRYSVHATGSSTGAAIRRFAKTWLPITLGADSR
jgi:hypothetical protein